MILIYERGLWHLVGANASSPSSSAGDPAQSFEPHQAARGSFQALYLILMPNSNAGKKVLSLEAKLEARKNDLMIIRSPAPARSP